MIPHREESLVARRGSRQFSWFSECVVSNPEAVPSHWCWDPRPEMGFGNKASPA